MQIVDFTAVHVEQATQIAMQNYNDERRYVSALPPMDAFPNLLPEDKNILKH